MARVDATLKGLLAPIVQTMGYEFVGCELLSQGRGSSTLRIFIDNEKGITVDDCSKVSRQVSAMLDVEDPIKGEYLLEVSSPGLNRPLFEIEHYQRYVGSQVKVRVHAPQNNRRNFVGELLRVDGTDVHLLVDQEEVILAFSNIEKAKIIADI